MRTEGKVRSGLPACDNVIGRNAGPHTQRMSVPASTQRHSPEGLIN